MWQNVLRLILIAVLFFGLANIIKNFKPSIEQLSSPKTVSWKDAPEMEDILQNEDQTKRLTATRKFVERVGVEDALEILEHSPLPHTGEGHLAVHQIGFYAYQKYGLDSILKCKDYFLYACYHGAIIEAATDQGFEKVKEMTDVCKEYPVRHFQCVHAAGHAIMAIWNYDLEQALTTCDELYEKETEFPEALSSCHNGAFMENLFGVHDWGTGKEQKRDWLSDDPFYPCDYFGDKYQKGCWLNQAARIYQMNGSDLVKTAKLCQEIGDNQKTIWCMDNLARQIHPLTNGDPAKAFELCQMEGSDWYDNCLVINAGSFYSVGGRDQAIFICQNVPSYLKVQCYNNVIGQIVSDPVDKSQKFSLCQRIEEPFRSQCFQSLALTN